MNPALFMVFFFWCGGGEVFCEEGRMTHHSCAAAEAWLRAGLKPDQALLIAGCEATDQHNPSAASLWEEPSVPLLAARKVTAGGN